MIRFMTTAESVSRRDVVVAVGFSLLAVALMLVNLGAEEVDAHVLAVPAFVAVTAPLAWRRKLPIMALSASLVALLVHVALFGELIRCGVVFPTTFILVFAAAVWLERLPALGGLTLGLALVVTLSLTDEVLAGIADAPAFGALTAAFWAIGRVVRSRGRLVQTLEAQNDELRVARDERARLEVATDRTRLSAELDELLQRRLGELARLADTSRSDDDPAAATAALANIERKSRRTLEEMRAVVGVLRDDSDAPTVPQPTLTHLEAMLLRAKGSDARLTVKGSPRVLPAAVELSSYRIVEHLLAALDDAPGVDVEVRFGDDALELTVMGPARRRSRAAVERARERARLHRGTLDASVRDGRAKAVALLPVAAT